MPRVSILLLVVCAGCLFEKSVGYNYYIQTSPGFLYPLFPPYPAIWDPNCDKKKEEGGSKAGSSGEEGGSKEESSGEEDGSKEGGESKEGGSSESGEGSKEGEGEKEGEGKSEESGSSEEGEKKEGSSEESGEKKKEGEEKRKRKYVFPPGFFAFPPSSIQTIPYSPLTSYSYVPYKRPYVIQQVASYPLKSSYQYVSVPSTAGVFSGYSAPRVAKLMTGLNYPQVPKTVVSPQVYSVPGSWSNAYSYYK